MRILVTGDKSYVGISLKSWLSKWPDKYNVDFISVRDDKWKNNDFSNYDVLFHVAAIVHEKEEVEMEELYYGINKDLTIELANKAKMSGIKQFIFMSSMSVYGLEGKVEGSMIINSDTPCNPTTFYGKSKLGAEEEINKLNDENFKVVIIRAPMVYGPDCPGNYARLRKLAIKVPIFPLINNQRSMIFIDNLTEFIRLMVENQEEGLFFPQDKEYVNTSELVKEIAKENSKKVYLSKSLYLGIIFFGKKVNVLNKVFGNLVFDLKVSNYGNFSYCVSNFEESIKVSEKQYRDGC